MYAYRSMVRVHENIYELKRVFLQSSIKDVEVVKEWLGCTDAFYHDIYILFCSIIEDVEIVEEIPFTEDKPEMITELNCTVIETIYPDIEPETETKQPDNE
jgi:hypothetical protein